MAEIKFTKSELRLQQNRLHQLDKYLPTLQLKKAMLQSEVSEARSEIVLFSDEYQLLKNQFETFSALLSNNLSVDLSSAIIVTQVNRRYENIAGVEVPYFDSVIFKKFSYSLFDSPPWIDSVIKALRKISEANIKVEIAKEKKIALEKELRDVAIRVNLFEKILIPRASKNIKRIKVFLGDQQLTAVSQAKASKAKIESNKNLPDIYDEDITCASM